MVGWSFATTHIELSSKMPRVQSVVCGAAYAGDMGPVAVGMHFIAATAAPGLSYARAVRAERLHVACNAFW